MIYANINTNEEGKKQVVLSGKTAKRAPLGDQGLNEQANNLDRSTEHLPQLQNREGSLKYRMMSRGDATIGMLLRAHKNPVRSASWGIEKPDDATDAESKAVDIIQKWIFHDCSISWDTLLGQILSFLEYGFSCFELFWQVYEFENKKYFVPYIDQRLQTSIENIWVDQGIIRQMTITKGVLEIPIEEMVFFTLNQQGLDLRGESILRSAYPSWERKQTREFYIDMGFQRGAGGIPKGTVPKGTDPESKEYQAFESLLQNMTSHEDAYMILTEGYDLEILNTNFNADQFQKSVDALNTQMALSVLAQFVLLGQGGKGGAYALSRDQSDFFLDGLQYVVSLVERTIHRHVISPFIKINFGKSVDPDRIMIKGVNLNKKAGEELANVLGTLKAGGFIKPTVDDEVRLRKFLEMPELTEEEIEDRKNAKESFMENNPFINNDPRRKQDDDDPEENRHRHPVKFAELKRDVKKRNDYIQKTITEVMDFMKAHLLMIKDKFMADIETTLNRGTVEIQGLKNIELSTTKYRQGLERKLAGIAEESFNRAKAGAKANNVKFADINPSDLKKKSLKALVQNTAIAIVEDQANRLKARAILSASTGPIKGYSKGQTISNVDRTINDFIDSSGNAATGALIVVDTANFGEMEFYKEIEDQLWGYEFVNADPVSDICKWYNGKTFSVNSPELAEATAPLHSQCKSFLRPIYKSEAKPKIDDVIAPPSIRKQKNIY